MDLTLQERAETLSEALPYIQKYYGKTIIVKYGGNAMVSEELVEAVTSDLVMLSLVGVRVIVVHGGGPAINKMLSRLQIPTRKINGLRYTDQDTMDVVQSVLCGQVNKNIVNLINTRGGHAIGLCGLDDHLIQAKKLDNGDGIDYGLVGEITSIDPTIIGTTLMSDTIPVIATVAEGIDGNKCYNINADTAAAEIAAAVHAEKLILMTDVRGVLRDPDDPDTLIHQILPMEIPYLEQDGVVTGGMIPKVECCANALEHGVKRTHILDGRIPHAILIEMLTHRGIGTMIWKGENK